MLDKWNHIVCTLLNLAPFTYYNAFWVLSILLLVSVVLFIAEWCFIIWLYHFLFSLQLRIACVVSSFWQLWIKLLWTFAFRFLCGHKFSFDLGKSLVMRFWDHVVFVLTISETAKLFFLSLKWVCLVTVIPAYVRSSRSSISSVLGTVIFLKT